MSIGRTGPPAPVVQEAINYAVSRGAFVVVAAGNGFEEGNLVERYAEFAPADQRHGERSARSAATGAGHSIQIPAATWNLRRREATLASAARPEQSCSRPTTWTSSTPTWRTPAQFRAPRFDVFAYQPFQGTSMAAPHVSGFAALLIQQGITSPAAIEAVMKHYATDLGPSGRDNEFGYGLINPRASLRGMGLAK